MDRFSRKEFLESIYIYTKQKDNKIYVEQMKLTPLAKEYYLKRREKNKEGLKNMQTDAIAMLGRFVRKVRFIDRCFDKVREQIDSDTMEYYRIKGVMDKQKEEIALILSREILMKELWKLPDTNTDAKVVRLEDIIIQKQENSILKELDRIEKVEDMLRKRGKREK